MSSASNFGVRVDPFSEVPELGSHEMIATSTRSVCHTYRTPYYSRLILTSQEPTPHTKVALDSNVFECQSVASSECLQASREEPCPAWGSFLVPQKLIANACQNYSYMLTPIGCFRQIDCESCNTDDANCDLFQPTAGGFYHTIPRRCASYL